MERRLLRFRQLRSHYGLRQERSRRVRSRPATHGDTSAHSDTHANSDAYTGSFADTHTESDTYANSNTHAWSDPYSHADAHTWAYVRSDNQRQPIRGRNFVAIGNNCLRLRHPGNSYSHRSQRIHLQQLVRGLFRRGNLHGHHERQRSGDRQFHPGLRPDHQRQPV